MTTTPSQTHELPTPYTALKLIWGIVMRENIFDSKLFTGVAARVSLFVWHWTGSSE
jgi:hypothetical protein